MAFQIGGLASGIDGGKLVDQLMAAERRPVTLLETRKAKLQAVSAAFTGLSSKLGGLKTKAEELKDPAKFFARSVTSSTDTVATATAAAGNTRGTFTITPTALAKGSIAAASVTKASLTDVVASSSGNFEFKLGATGSVVSVAVTSATTLEQLVKDINDKNAGVKATAINVGTSAAPAYKLTLTSDATGAANNIVIVTDPTTLSIANTQTATDAAFSVTGLGAFTRSSNTFSDVIEGVTITLKASSGSTDLAIDYDKTGTEAKVKALIDFHNDTVKVIASQSAATKSADGKVTGGAFTGDATARQISTSLKAIIATSFTGPYRTLADLGITTSQTDGTLALDSTKFQKALSDNPTAVRDMVAGTSTKDGVADLLYTAADSMTKAVTGSIVTRQDGMTNTIRSIDKQIETSLRRLEIRERTLREQFVNLEKYVNRTQTTGNALLAQLTNLENSRILTGGPKK